MLQLKDYQQIALNSLEAYFRACVTLGDADLAFYGTTREIFGTGLNYLPVAELPALPYICLRLPTGGGKTLVACHAVGHAAKYLLQTERCVALWLVPSNAILEQTLHALRDRHHPYRQALEFAFGSVSVLDVSEALYVSRPTLDTATTIIVSTLQAFRVEDTEGRKVYDASGALMSHFENLPIETLAGLDGYGDGAPKPSLANVLRVHRPIVIVDEAHNARTPLAFEVLSRFAPACIVEFTATPDTKDHPSNVIHSVSALALQAEDMIKMPIRLETRRNWKELLADAVTTLKRLEDVAQIERRETGEYIRPIMLLQAQPTYKNKPSLTVEVVKECLLNDFPILRKEVAVATGSQWELDDIDLSSVDCPIRYIITIQALREGWDCPFAYMLCSVAEMHSSTAVEQILGRVMRLPRATLKKHPELNMAYAFAASENFAEAATALTDALIENGFNPQEARDFLRPAELPTNQLSLILQRPVIAAVAEIPSLIGLPDDLLNRITLDANAGTLAFAGVMSNSERDMLKRAFVSEAGQAAVDILYQGSQGDPTVKVSSPAERGELFAIPQLAIKQGDLFEQFDETHLLEAGWSLVGHDASLTEAEFSSQDRGSQTGEIGLDNKGKVIARFVPELQRQMALITSEQWNPVQLMTWVQRNIPHADLEPDDVASFLRLMLRFLLDERGLPLDYLIHHKYRLRLAAEGKIDAHRRSERKRTFQGLLLGDSSTPLVVREDVQHIFDMKRLPPYYSLYQGNFAFNKHYYGANIVGDMNKEEADCAFYIDSLAEVKFWVRNPVRTYLAFSLQTATDRFYPDFACLLHDKRYLVIEYKGADRWGNPEETEKRQLGELWEARSGGKCLFVMPRGPDMAAIQAKL